MAPAAKAARAQPHGRGRLTVEDWFAEPPFAGYQQRYRVRRRLHAATSPWQTVEIVDLESFGVSLVLGGTLQTSLGEEFTYHEMLVHVPMFAHPRPRRVLIIGGGDGGALRHVLLHPTVERAVEVEIDRAVVDASRQYLPAVSGGAYDDERAELLIADGAEFVATTDERFDVILIDSTDPVGPAAALIGDAFLQATRNVLETGGLVVMQSGSPITQPREWHATTAAFRRAFATVRPYLGWVPIYPGVLWSWVAGSGSDGADPAALDDSAVASRLAGLAEPLRIYNPAAHRAAFALPTFLTRLYDVDRPLDAAALRAAGHPFPGVVA